MAQILVPITTSIGANTDILLPGGLKLSKIGAAYKFVGSDGTLASAHSVLSVVAYNTLGTGEIALKADRKNVKCGDAMDAKCSLVLLGIAQGEAQGFGES